MQFSILFVISKSSKLSSSSFYHITHKKKQESPVTKQVAQNIPTTVLKIPQTFSQIVFLSACCDKKNGTKT